VKTRTLSIGLLALAALGALAAVAAVGVDLSHLTQLDWHTALVSGLMLANGPVAIPEQIRLFEAKRIATVDKASELVQKAVDEGRTMDDHESEQHTGFVSEVEAIDKHIKILKDHEKMQVALATPVTARDGAGGEGGAAAARSSITVKSNLPPGIRFTRFALAMAQAKGNVMLAHEIAKTRYADTPEVVNVLKAAISVGGTRELSGANDGPLIHKAAVTAVTGSDTAIIQYTDIEAEFIELLRPKTIMGRMDRLNRVPFLSRLGRQLTGVTGSFVGEGAPKPVQKQTYDNVTLGYSKVAVIVVLSDESNRFGTTINVELRARDDMVKGIATYIDKRFMDPSYSGVANVSPASITNGATRYQSTGSTLAAIDNDVKLIFGMFTTSDVDPSSAVWVMSAGVALRLTLKRDAYDKPAFPGMENAVATGRGTWYGLPVLVSNAMVTSGSPAEQQIALVTQDEVSLADDGGVSIDMSQEASVQMNDAPSAGAQSLVSLWQNNLIGIRAEQYINWGARRPNNLGIALLENTNY
jgi:HK97 family phage major capsid protein